MMRGFFGGAAAVYLFAALMMGVIMSRSMPTLNAWGATYAGLTWPVAFFCAASAIPGCTHLPPPGSALSNSFFTFKDDQ